MYFFKSTAPGPVTNLTFELVEEAAVYSKLDKTYFIQVIISWEPPLETNGNVTVYLYSIDPSDRVSNDTILSGTSSELSVVKNITVSPYMSYTASVQASTTAGAGDLATKSIVSPEAGIVLNSLI